MQIDLRNIDNLISALASGRRRIDELSLGQFSLGAACELAAWSTVTSYKLPASWRNTHPLVTETHDLLNGGKAKLPAQALMHVDESLCPIRFAGDLATVEWNSFLMRFAASLGRAGFTDGLNQGVVGAFEEMADNIIQHANLGRPGINGVVGYSVRGRSVAFSVIDTGVGAVASLKDNPTYANIKGGREALDLIARCNASRRVGQGAGMGYKDLFVGFSRLNGTVRLRSDDGLFIMEGALDACQPVGFTLMPVTGFFLSVECSL